MDFIIINIWLLLFVAWGLPLGYYRSKFRKIVYQTDRWTINIRYLFNSQTQAEKHIAEYLRILKELR